ncbi:MAG: AAA family ATPase [Dehalococcoidia bacterium]
MNGRSEGRLRELSQLLASFDEAAQFGARCVVVTGEPGIGKSWLLAEARRLLTAERAVRILEGYALDLPGLPPAFPLATALGAAVTGLSERQDTQLQSARAALAAVGIGPPLLETPVSADLGNVQDQLRGFEALTVLLRHVAADNPVVILLDDLQWASTFTWDALLYATRALSNAPVFFVLAARDEILDGPTSHGASAIAELLRLRLLHHLPLGALEPAGIVALAAARLGKPLSSHLVDRLVERSEGNPFFAEELVQGWREHDLLVERADAWDWAGSGADDRAVPQQLRLAIDVRINGLPAATDAAMAAAATLGREFPAHTVATMLDISPEAVGRDLEPAVRGAMLDPTPRGWRFRHDTIREAVVARHLAQAVSLHATAAAALSRELGHAPGFQELAALAHHWIAAGDYGRGAPAALAAVRAAGQVHATAEALEWARIATDACERADLSESTSNLLFDARLAHGTAAIAHAVYEEGTDALHVALEVAGDDPLQQGLAWFWLGTAERRRERAIEAAGALSRAVDCLQGVGHAIELGRALVALADLDGLTRGRYDEARANATRALAIAREVGDRELAARAALALANVEVRTEDPLGGRALLRAALEDSLAVGDIAMAVETCATLTNSYYWSGELRESIRYAELRRELAERAGDIFALRHAHSWLALLEVTRGEWNHAEELLRRSEHDLARLASPEPLAFLQVVDGFMHFRRGDLPRACELLAQAVATFSAIDDATVVWYGSLLALVYARAGRVDDARAEVSAQETRLQSLPDAALPARSARCALTLALTVLGDLEAAAACADRLQPYPGDYHWSPGRLSLATVAAARGDVQTALAELEMADLQAREQGRRPDIALIQLQRARLLERRPALAAATDAANALAELGMQADLALAQDLVASLSSGPGPGGLSPREIEVLRLVTQGRTNREIAQLLVISERTAVNHVSHIFNKLAVANRAEATAWAARQGLV